MFTKVRQAARKFGIRLFLSNMSRKLKFNYNLRRITDILPQNQYTIMISHKILLRRRNVSDKSFIEYQNTFHVQLRFPENRAFFEITWKNMAQTDRPQTTNIIRRQI